MNYAQTFLMANLNAFPPEVIPVIQKELEELDDQSINALLMFEVKNPTIALLLSILVGEFGVDRFYIGNKELGFAKLALLIFSFITLAILIGFFLLIAVYIWKIVDCFLIMKACKQDNFERFMKQMHQSKMIFHSMPSTARQATKAVLSEPVDVEVALAEKIVSEPVATGGRIAEPVLEADNSIISVETEKISESEENNVK